MNPSYIAGRPPTQTYLTHEGGADNLGDGRQTVTTSGTAVQLSTGQKCTQVTVTAMTTNTDIVVVGSSTVVASAGTRRGIPLYPSNSITLSVNDLKKVYIDAIVNGEGVTYAYLN